MHGENNTKKVATNVHHLTRLEVLITVLTKIQVLRKIIGRLSVFLEYTEDADGKLV